MMDVELTDVGKRWFQGHNPQGWAAEFIEPTCLGTPYRIPPDVDVKPTVKRAKVIQ